MELDHFFILTEPGAPQAALLSEIGLIEGTPNDHPGQGTANRRFFFSDAALEFLYVRDAVEAREGPARRLRIVERETSASASPFGLVVKTASRSTDAPFRGWRYYPDYFGADQYFHIGENSDLLEEPLCICAPFGASSPTGQPPPADTFSGVTEVRISVPVIQPSSVLETIAQCERISLRLGEPHRMEIVFNDKKQGQFRDLEPELPLVLRW